MEVIAVMVPEFVIAGHPNEGKSSVLSTLTEDDSVRISPFPGETRECRSFPVRIDQREIIRFVDTPGFQNPLQTLKWMRAWRGPDQEIIQAFIESHRGRAEYHDDCALLEPMIQAAGIIFVVDGSRPMRKSDRAEMEILRLTGKPRMAVINCKADETAWLQEWRHEFRKHFNSIRIFNSCRETFTGRISLLESLKGMDQELYPALEMVIRIIKQDWQSRRELCAEIIADTVERIVSLRQEHVLHEDADVRAEQQRGADIYRRTVQGVEEDAFQRIRRIYRHNRYNCSMPEPEILDADIFSRASWEFLGLSRKQLVLAGAAAGAAAGAMIDIGHGGLSLGLFSAAGGLVGAAGTALRGRELLSGKRVLGMRLDREKLVVGPASNIQLLYILIDRALIFHAHITGWAHGRRDYENAGIVPGSKRGYTSSWDRSKRRICERFFAVATGNARVKREQREEIRHEFRKVILEALETA